MSRVTDHVISDIFTMHIIRIKYTHNILGKILDYTWLFSKLMRAQLI